jgi:glycosyltransferase involved in cell wall biosynthesis
MDEPTPAEKFSWLAFPMHGQHKLLAEGYRTRDGHMIEWFGRLAGESGSVAVVSRPEPRIAKPLRRKVSTSSLATNTTPIDSYSWAFPDVRDRRKWWLQSARDYQVPSTEPSTVPAIIWNPFVGRSPVANKIFDDRVTVFDLLDDWTVHYAFDSIKSETEEAYRATFARATHVTANAEGTLALAHRFGRLDAKLVTNGCDPERFATQSTAVGPITVGYVGKIGRRVDLELVLETAQRLPEVNFVLAGPILDREYRKPLAKVPNITLSGDVHYSDVPDLLRTFDIGWVPHRVGEGEVGGDVIKTYEYRAAHLPVLTTPIAGAGRRNLDGVFVIPADEHAGWIAAASGQPRVPRIAGSIPYEATWESKAKLLFAMGHPSAKRH